MTIVGSLAPALLERERELAALQGAVAAARAGAGRIVIVEGEAGIGKTELISAGSAAAAEQGMELLRARGGELERALTFGVVRQLFEARVARAGAAEQDELLSGAARSTRSLLGLATPDGPPADEASIVHGLYWLSANLADRQPLCVTIDDAQWSDQPSLRFALYLARRLQDMPVVLLVGVRTGEPGAPEALLETLATQPNVVRLDPARLSRAATRTLLTRAFDREADTSFADAVQEATDGNPFLTRELVSSLAQDGVAPTADEVARVSELQPEAVARSMLLRLSRLPPEATPLARAVAILGTEASLGQAAALSQLDLAAAAAAADALTSAQLLKPGRPLEFMHPLIRSVLYRDIPAAERSLGHARAARILRDEGRPAADVAAHLLEAEPAGDPEVVEALRAAVRHETDPTRAAALLARALAEPPAPLERPVALLELGETETQAYQPDAIRHLMEARDASTDGAHFIRATRALARAWTLHADPAKAVAWAQQELARLGDPDDEEERELKLSLLALETIRGSVDRDRALALREEAKAAATQAQRYLLAALGYKAITWGTARDAYELGEAALRGGLLAEGVRGTGFMLALSAVQYGDAHERVWEVGNQAVLDAQARGDVSGYALALVLRADAAKHRGLLNEAKADAIDALELAFEHGIAWAEPVLMGSLLEIAAEDGRIDEVLARIPAEQPAGWLSGSSRAGQYLYGRGLLHLAQGNPADGFADLQAAGEIAVTFEVDHPVFMPWRSSAGRALLALGRHDEAAELARAELELARGFGAPHAVGPALRILGLITGGEDGLELLDESVDVLTESEALLERARSLVELGAALRRANQRAAARDPLRRGLDLAQRCGAALLAERAEQELEATGARPRRRELSGIDALTPSERRVAEMAARGMGNRDIAQELFLSIRTIENQLRQVYLKLEITGRKELPGMFEEA